MAIAVASVIPFQAFADHEELPTIIIEGSAMRPGTFGAAPDSSSLADTASLLKRVPGANVNRNGPLTGIAAYRGMFGNRININIDGANMKEVGPNSMDPPLSHIPAPLTGTLQLYRGIAPVSSGIDTIGGAMKAESKKGHFAEGEGIETSGNASMGYSSVQDGHFGTLLGAVANQNHKIYLGGSQERGRDYKFRNNQKVVPSQYDRNAFTTGYGYQRDGHEFGINYSENDTGRTGTPALPMDIVYVRGGLYDAKYSWDMGGGYTLKTNLFYQKMRHLMDNNSLRTPMMMNGGPMLMNNRTNVEAGGLDAALSMPFLTGKLTVGINGDQSNHDAIINGSMLMPAMGMMAMPMRMPIQVQNFNKVERDRYSVFTEWSGDIAEDLSLELGARFTHTWSDAGDVSTTRMMLPSGVNEMALATAFNASDRNKSFDDVDLVSILRYTMSSSLDLEFGLARKNRAPSYQELYLWSPSEATSGLADGKNYVGNLNLNHETAYQVELGFDWHTGKFYAAPRAFYHYVDDYIQGVPHPTIVNTLQFDNIQAQLFGIDLEAGYAIDDNWRIDAGLNYVRGMRINSPTGDDDLYRIAPLNGRTQLTYENAGWMGAIEGVFYADQGDVAGYNDELPTKGYMLLNLRGKYEPIQGLVVSTGIENVMDIEHYDHLGGYNRVLDNPNLVQGSRIPMQGRNVYATLSYSW